MSWNELPPAPELLEPDAADHTPERDQAQARHDHYCMVCDSYWVHDEGDGGCVDLSERDCPQHDDRDRLP